MKKTILFFLLFAIKSSLSYSINELAIEHIGFEQGLNQITVFALYQDELGGIWIGTNDGLKHYSGNRVEAEAKTKDHSEVISGIVSTICGDQQGNVYALINNKTVVYNLQAGSISYLPLPKELANLRSTALCYGKMGLWIGIDNTIYNYQNGKTQKHASLTATKSTLSTISETTEGELLIGTIDQGAYLLDKKGKEICILPAKVNVTNIIQDSKKQYWVCTSENGLYRIDKKGNTIAFTENSELKNRVASNAVRSICEDNYHNLWIGTFAGLDKFNTTTNSIEHHGHSTDKRHSLTSPSIRCLTKDKQGTIWAGTYYGGINYFNPEPETFRFFDFKKSDADFTYPIIGKTIIDKHGNLWICTDGKGLIFFNQKLNKFEFYTKENSGISGNNIKSLYYNPSLDQLWIGTYRNGLNRLNIPTKQFTHYKIGQSNSNIPNELEETVQAIVESNDKLYIGTINGIYSFETKSGAATHVTLSKSIRDLLIDRNSLWAATQEGLVQISLKTLKITQFFKQDTQQNNLPKNRITKLFLDNKKQLWLATDGGGIVLYDSKSKQFIRYNQQNCGMENDNVSCLSQTKDGSILAGTSKGFSKIDPIRKKSINYSHRNGFPLISMNFGYINHCNNGEIIMSGIDGMTIFNEKVITAAITNFNVRFDRLWINNTLVTPNDDNGILDTALPYSDKITLSADQKIIAIEIATNNYIKSKQPNFEYKLEGFDKQWLPLDEKNTINYMNLPPGSYTLKVRNARQQEGENGEGIQLLLRVKPPMYASWYAYLLYFVLLTGISSWVLSFYQSRVKLRTSLEIERREKVQNEIANQSKLRFFTNISHEFRTPLTLILGQLEILMQSPKIAPNFYRSIINIHKNAVKMHQLINELLDFRKQEQGFKKLKVREQNFVAFVEEIYLSFQDHATLNEIELTFNCQQEKIMLWFDAIELQKVFYNIISNAFKFTPKGGKIAINIDVEISNVSISISDTGIGISKENLNKIFDQFYQADNNDNEGVVSVGTGIGLALARGIVELHVGKISAESTPFVGSTFHVVLQKGNKHFTDQNKVEIDTTADIIPEENIITTTIDSEFLKEAAENHNDNFKEKPTLLIVEDNSGLRQMLVQIFEPMYIILEAVNGKEGYLMASENQPDLILSDVMMPEMNGNEMCSKLKDHFETSHIPVVLLTAQSSIAQNIEGLKRGADDYITKPFNVNILVTRCNNLLLGRKLLQEKFSKQIDNSTYDIASNALDQEFIDKAVSIVENNIEKESLDVNFLCSEMAIGRRVFFNKMKSITGKTPNDFIQNIRLKKAAWIILNVPNKTISEISEELGYNSVSYFGKCFKAKFGVFPSAYRTTGMDGEI
jgi:signal transduction histidine kinase/ligand-binding sensor domain-containing protein/CheY-like chemotaxis protein/AraC-like DNA-binding protein